MTGVSALAAAAPIWPLIRIGVPGSLASRRCGPGDAVGALDHAHGLTVRTGRGRAAGAGREWLSGCHVFSRRPGGCAGPLGGWAGPAGDGRTPGSRGGVKSELLIRFRNT
jgi:hypothetical protein